MEAFMKALVIMQIVFWLIVCVGVVKGCNYVTEHGVKSIATELWEGDSDAKR